MGTRPPILNTSAALAMPNPTNKHKIVIAVVNAHFFIFGSLLFILLKTAGFYLPCANTNRHFKYFLNTSFLLLIIRDD
jgi:hypothetical protein